MSNAFPSRARIVIVGGGIIGCSTAYHLVRSGWQDVVLVEKAQLTSGSTWHAAGAVGQLRRTAGITQMIAYSTDLYGRLEAETEQGTGWRQCGSIRLACSEERKEELERAVTVGRSFGVDVRMIPLEEVQAKIPVVSLEGVIAAAYIPNDGMVNPTDVTMALAKGARMKGARLFEETKVTGFVREDGRVAAVETTRGTIACEKVVLCGGIWAREVGRLAGVNIPLQPNHDQYAVTDVIPGLPRNSPNLRDPDNHIYFKEEIGGYAYGNYDQNPTAYDISPIPENHAFHLFEPALDHFTATVEDAVRRVPALAQVGIKRFIHGLESFTEDSMPIMGEAPELQDFYVACGFNGFGIASGGGAGRAMADWITDGRPRFDLGAADIRRFGPHHRSNRMVRSLALDGQRRHYALARPSDEARVARMFRRSPVHAALAAAGAHFTAVVGWETPDYFDVAGGKGPAALVHEEHAAAKQAVALVDDSSRAKFAMVGQGVGEALSGALAGLAGTGLANLAEGDLASGFLLNAAGGLDCDVTVTRTGPHSYLLTTAAARSTSLETHLRRLAKALPATEVLDVTGGSAVFLLLGPQAAALLGEVLEGEIGPAGRRSAVHLAGVPASVARTGLFGGAGFEVSVSTDYAAYLFERLQESGGAHGLRLAGSRALDLLRIESGAPAFGREIHAGTMPGQIGLAAGEPAEAGGRGPVLTRLFVAGGDCRPQGAEPVWRNGSAVGLVTSAAYAPLSDGSFVIAFVEREAAGGSLEIEMPNGRKVAASAHATAMEG